MFLTSDWLQVPTVVKTSLSCSITEVKDELKDIPRVEKKRVIKQRQVLFPFHPSRTPDDFDCWCATVESAANFSTSRNSHLPEVSYPSQSQSTHDVFPSFHFRLPPQAVPCTAVRPNLDDLVECPNRRSLHLFHWGQDTFVRPDGVWYFWVSPSQQFCGSRGDIEDLAKTSHCYCLYPSFDVRCHFRFRWLLRWWLQLCLGYIEKYFGLGCFILYKGP